MPDDLYDRDALAWSEQQAALLRRLAAGEKINAAVDWGHVVEEIEDVGGSALRAVNSLLRRALEHLMKLHGWPGARDAEHWRAEILTFLGDAADAFSPAMRQRIDFPVLYARARKATLAVTLDGRAPLAPPPACPFALDDLIAGSAEIPDIDGLLAKLDAAAYPPRTTPSTAAP